MRARDGDLYGTTYAGGANGYNNGGSGYGTIFKITPAGKETVVHNFSDAPDGAKPSGSLARDSAGNLYGTTENGGTCGEFSGVCGTVFKLKPEGKESILYSFQAATGDAQNPNWGVALGGDGNLYGTANGGAHGDGAVFKIDSSGKETVLYSFGGYLDGADPNGPVIMDSAGNIYGTTEVGGTCPNNGGTVFKLDPPGNETILHSFCAGAHTGSYPSGPILRDKAGNIYGVTGLGGDLNCADGFGNGCGTIFELDTTGKVTVLHAFRGGANDGGGPTGLIRDASGNFYGTTAYGGTCSANSTGCGIVFKWGSSGYSVLHKFVGGITDGMTPFTPPLLFSGALYGTTALGGASSNGTIYKLVP